MERSRQKQAWEETLPKTASKRNNAIRLSCIASIAANEIAFRESVLDAEGEKRLELSKENIRDERKRMLMSLKTRLENMKWEKSEENTMIMKLSNRQFRRSECIRSESITLILIYGILADQSSRSIDAFFFVSFIRL